MTEVAPRAIRLLAWLQEKGITNSIITHFSRSRKTRLGDAVSTTTFTMERGNGQVTVEYSETTEGPGTSLTLPDGTRVPVTKYSRRETITRPE